MEQYADNPRAATEQIKATSIHYKAVTDMFWFYCFKNLSASVPTFLEFIFLIFNLIFPVYLHYN